MMLIEPYAERIFSILVSHGNFPASNGMHLQFKHDEFLYHAARDLSGYQYESANGSIISLRTYRRGSNPLVLEISESSSPEEKQMIAEANDEIQSFVFAETSRMAEYVHANILSHVDNRVPAL